MLYLFATSTKPTFQLFIILETMFTERRDFQVDIHLPFSLNAQILNII